jgi:ribosomal protein L28
MSRICSICGKGYVTTTKRKKLRSKYNPTTKKRKYPNLQWVTLGNNKRVKACAKCVKAMAKKK